MAHVETLVHHAQIVSEVGISAIAFGLWDILISFQDEVEYIWQKQYSWVTWCYAFTRYFPVLSLITLIPLLLDSQPQLRLIKGGCEAWYTYEALVAACITSVVDAILMVRVYIMYNQNNYILVTLLVFWVFLISMTGLGISLGHHFVFTEGCLVVSAPRLLAVTWAASLALDALLFLLTMLKFLKGLWAELKRHSMVYLLVRDNTWAFALIFGVKFANAMMYLYVKTTLTGLFFNWVLIVMSSAGSHLILNVRRKSAVREIFMHSQSMQVMDDVTSEGLSIPHFAHSSYFSTIISALDDITVESTSSNNEDDLEVC
ncbi:hypothetical protein C8Q75DRAFT_447596 [Abortiporus biennis]|nr:hypothetical protein C8Q75DRAFT_447596 [Abortiporus biennis]